MKKISKFWKIYVFSVTALVLVCAIALCVVYSTLISYEVDAELKREAEESQRLFLEEQAAESKRLEQAALEAMERDRSEKESVSRVIALNNVNSVLFSLRIVRNDMSEAYEKSTPKSAVKEFVSKLNSEGSKAFMPVCTNARCKYEAADAIFTYIRSLGEFSYVMSSDSAAMLYAGGIKAAELTLKPTKPEHFGFVSYEVQSASAYVPCENYTVIVPTGTKLSVNGADCIETRVTYQDSRFDGIPAKYKVPKFDKYTLNNFIGKPVFKAYQTLNNSTKTELLSITDGNTVEFLPPKNSLYSDALSERAIFLAEKCGDFIAGEFKFNEIKPYLLSGTPLYKQFSGYDNRWYFDHASLANTNKAVVDFRVYSETLVYAKVTYRQMLYNGEGKLKRAVDVMFELFIVCTETPSIPDITTATDVTPPDTETVPEPYDEWVIAALYFS